ncbi:hypothetical protein LX36DRAFT_455245 [Colletotrichum falcatum]|nr:hypothetical protein LX36DRAFT_455245 [Colletotrichum falcatum]
MPTNQTIAVGELVLHTHHATPDAIWPRWLRHSLNSRLFLHHRSARLATCCLGNKTHLKSWYCLLAGCPKLLANQTVCWRAQYKTEALWELGNVPPNPYESCVVAIEVGFDPCQDEKGKRAQRIYKAGHVEDFFLALDHCLMEVPWSRYFCCSSSCETTGYSFLVDYSR